LFTGLHRDLCNDTKAAACKAPCACNHRRNEFRSLTWFLSSRWTLPLAIGKNHHISLFELGFFYFYFFSFLGARNGTQEPSCTPSHWTGVFCCDFVLLAVLGFELRAYHLSHSASPMIPPPPLSLKPWAAPECKHFQTHVVMAVV
jgi:hypothetical protein